MTKKSDDLDEIRNVLNESLAKLEEIAMQPEFVITTKTLRTKRGLATSVVVRNQTMKTIVEEELLTYLPQNDGKAVQNELLCADKALIEKVLEQYLLSQGFERGLGAYNVEFSFLTTTYRSTLH